MPDGIVWAGGWGCGAALGGMFSVAFERAPDQVAGAKTHGESKRGKDLGRWHIGADDLASLGRMPPSWAWAGLHPMICADRVPACATEPVASWSSFNFCWDTFRCRPRSDTWAANNASAELSMMGSALNRSLDRAPTRGSLWLISRWRRAQERLADFPSRWQTRAANSLLLVDPRNIGFWELDIS
jgi:hypothetical protein